ncbi:flagellar motor stator protein MotA [Sulfitobacter sp. M57]|uniref:flagellar motor stator protein MotA n=1 Tax=unclassified Sulfitobacter TaxID=196795 RepID=UPI0023E2157F|nr:MULTISPECIES: flagellar motor stator protein MotA [unclassified Sulfitobacter]MDF3415212.1 flagellar motor stator protein MotA [Sulfitobacter sp. KE5]MDF3422693.1 flagellar motor stator protein MotA [Sulfitobacter sp. KE43]MDF3433758.1 flagellar motor stator protein MotA [Sulfitobacter sp. KE42]MDF3459398.1 flagellar motor stator protein MotA [Sulfitobacter sp. S74]MDF3463297.1 flagellar motor stator protein MotA [Sulfitobacter sp. Ks18]
MIGIIGIITIFIMVFGGYVAAGGKMGIIIKALPFEMMMIGGAAVGAFLLSNDGAAVKHTIKDVGKVFKGPKWKPDDYRDLLCLLFELIRLARQNPVAIEEHIETPEESSIFSNYPKIMTDKEAIALICDTMRSASMNYDDPHQVEEVLEKRMEANAQHALHSSHALQMVADALPALGIVAAVLGVIKTMASIDQPPEILGKMIGGALVGTFLGVFLAYAIIGPFAEKVKGVTEDEANFYKLIREVLVANLHNHATNICIEVGRQNTPSHRRPSFADLEEALKALKQEAA